MSRTATQTMEDARRWADKNPTMWRAFQRRALERTMDGERWSARGIAEAIRWDGRYKRAAGEDFKVPNHITPALGRMVCEMHPEAAAWFDHAKSKVDGVVA